MAEQTITSKKWSEEETKALISKFELLPSLWDVHSTEYKNRTVKQRELAELAADFGVDAAEVQRKLHILRSQYQQELKKINVRKSGQGAGESYKRLQDLRVFRSNRGPKLFVVSFVQQ